MKVVNCIEKIERALMTILFSVMVLCVFAQVVNRNIVQAGISWFEELSRYSMIYMTILGAEIGLRDGTQLAIDAFVSNMGAKVRRVVSYATTLIIIIFSAVVLVNSFALFNMFIQARQTTTAMKISMAIPFSAIPVGMALILLTQIIMLGYRIYNDFFNKNKGVTEA